MKFFTDSVARCAARIGTLNGFERLPNVSFETPLLLIYTKGGSVPHLTKDIFKNVTMEEQLLSVSLSSTILMKDVIKELDTSFADFVSMKEYINLLSIHDPAYTTNSGFQQLDSISVWSRTGRTVVSASKYMELVQAYKPDLYVALCDGDTNVNSSAKRVSKAVRRSKTLLEQCLDIHLRSDALKSKGILGPVEGGYNLQAREESIDYLKDKPLAGFVIDGLHNNGPSVQNISSEQIKQVVRHTINLLPTDKIRVSMGCWNPATVLDLIELGVDVFDSSYPYVITEQSQALTFMCEHDTAENNQYAMSIAEKRYADDFSPICKTCECLACQNHSRAYIHHLHHTKEMLGLVLLMIHNIHHYLQFFSVIRDSIKNGTFNQFQAKIRLKYATTNSESTTV
ncbi:queuine tRNA-ribosyltransferase accessory subunit 2 [Temnothorax curvispinosus]|uniref:Queuine tRNA-ribosyltransferase accessory subunit 2 n=1 Tax=Temnothorax curvispinosus TaxID=300111 RepID=A0A6J1QL48_9HYME|nr:queuine tRNA-ribosyltransferase accessory subunit 2 [Temnothorax curvispinosus]XP_024881285.1 queuine tRNA-ribosyltransferase accessory subunit 2 [Temnothorax curvispinosus]